MECPIGWRLGRTPGHVWLGIAKEFAVVADWFEKYLLWTADRKRNEPPD
jgi:hypothetical protein